MIDLHSHILCGLDDGAQTIEDTLGMARQAVQDGITSIVATPHHKDGKYHNPPERVYQKVAEVQVLLEEHRIPLIILPGMEIHVDGHEVAALEGKQLITYNNQHRHILLELPHDHVPRYIDKLLFDIQVAGYVPIIPHPERNREIASNPNLLYRMVKQGAMTQMTAASVSGKLGKKLQKTCFTMIKHHMVHLVATDAHNTGHRGAILSEAYHVIGEKFGQDYVRMYQDFAHKIVKGLDCPLQPVSKVKAKLFGIF